MRLWLALEIVAESTKERERVPVTCPACGGALHCAACHTAPTRVPMAKQAIESLIAAIAGKAAPDVSKRQFIARNGLMHGRSTVSIEAECGQQFEHVVNELGRLAWEAIMSTLPLAEEGPVLHLGHRDGQFTNLNLVMSVLGSFEHTEDSDHPSDDKVPNVKIDMLTRFGNPGDESEG